MELFCEPGSDGLTNDVIRGIDVDWVMLSNN